MIPTVNVRCRMFDPLGNPIAGARVTAKLTNVEIFNGYVVPEEVSAIAGPDGVATVALWPNALGATASMYTFRLTNPDNEGVARIVATIPNADCDLHLVANLPAYPGKTDGQMALEAGLVTINTQVGVATTKAGEAGSSAAAASGSASTATSKAAEATTSASDAAASALMATNKAGSATASANTATAKATEAANSASAALASKDAAALSEANSAASKLAAATSATNAATAEANTLTLKNTTTTAASNAAASETAALNAKNTAVSAAATATTKADEAATSATAAAADKVAAASSAITAQNAATTAQNAAASADAAGHIANTANPHSTTKAQVGLGNVDNTSDANKPVSTAQATAIAAKQATIAAGTTAQYYRGDKTWRDFATDVRATVLTGVSFATATAISDTDSVLVAFGKVQKQLTALIASVALKAALDSPVFTGTPTAPTVAAGTNSLQVANTAFVQSAIAALVNSSPTTLDTLNELATALGNDPNFATTMTNSLASKAGIFGGSVSAGVLDWNDVSNTRPGYGPTLLLGSDTNGPGGGGIDYYHVLNMEYASTNGTGNVSQLAIPYGNGLSDLRFRGRYSGTWTAWRKLVTDITGNAATATSAAACTGTLDTANSNLCLGRYGGRLNGYVYNDTSGIGFLTNSGGWALRVDYGTNNVTGFGNVGGFSDERLKTNWRSFDEDFVQRLAKIKNGIYDRVDIELTQVGVSAQSLQKLMPDAVSESEDGTLSVTYGNAALASSVEIAKYVVALEERIAQLEAKQ